MLWSYVSARWRVGNSRTDLARRVVRIRRTVAERRFGIGGCGVALFLDRDAGFPASSARAGRSRQCQSKWAGARVSALGTALVTAPFLFCLVGL
jgi:hypothetical protein